ncbi:hypothetical protein ACF0H5_014124 [Mactra antiquata]
MSLDIIPDVIEFGDVWFPNKCTIELSNNKTGEVKYKFRLQNNCLTLNHPAGVIQSGEKANVQVTYNPQNHENKQALLAMQLKTTEIIKGTPQPEKSTIINVKFTEDLDDMFKSPKASDMLNKQPTGKAKKWWAK